MSNRPSNPPEVRRLHRYCLYCILPFFITWALNESCIGTGWSEHKPAPSGTVTFRWDIDGPGWKKWGEPIPLGGMRSTSVQTSANLFDGRHRNYFLAGTGESFFADDQLHPFTTCWISTSRIQDLMLLGFVACIFVLMRAKSVRTRFLNRQCLGCGYDLRASVDRCSECGKAIPAR